MIFIAHRGNFSGPDKATENSVQSIDAALLKGFDVEIDVWKKNDGNLYLGHDYPQYKCRIEWIIERSSRMWIHCKNIEAADMLSNYPSLNFFMHDKDMATLTSKGYFWTSPGKFLGNKSIDVMPEINNHTLFDSLFNYSFQGAGICSDFCEKLREEYNNIATTKDQ